MTKPTKTKATRIVVMNRSYTYELKNGVNRTLPVGWVGHVPNKIAATIEKSAVGRIDKDRERSVLDSDAQTKANADAKAKADADAQTKANADAKADADAQTKTNAEAKAKADAEAKAKETLTVQT